MAPGYRSGAGAAPKVPPTTAWKGQQQRGADWGVHPTLAGAACAVPKQHLIIIIIKRASRDTTVLHSSRGNCKAKHEL